MDIRTESHTFTIRDNALDGSDGHSKDSRSAHREIQSAHESSNDSAGLAAVSIPTPLPARAAALWSVAGLLLFISIFSLLSGLRFNYCATKDVEPSAADGWGQLLRGAAAAKGGAGCGLDGMKAYTLSGWRKVGVDAQVRGSCDLCGLSANEVQAMLSLPHDCQKDAWEGDHWVRLKSLGWSKREEKPTCVVICASLIPCSPPVALNNSALALPSCLLSIWLRKGTSDSDVAAQIYFDEGRNSMFSLNLPSPQQLPISTILDAGANVGLMSLFFATMYPGAMIVSMEVSSSNYDMLVLNTARFLNIRPLQRALWSSATTLCLVHGSRNIKHKIKQEWTYQVLEKSMVPQADEVLESMQSKSVADVLHMYGLQSFDLIKMDVEGSEGAVFSPGSDISFLQDSRMFIMELHPDMWKGASELVHKAFKKYPMWRRASYIGEHELWLAEGKGESD